MSAAHILPLSLVPECFCGHTVVKWGGKFTSTGALSQACPGLPVATTLDNNRTSWFHIPDNPSWDRPGTSSFSRKGVQLSILVPLFC